MEEYRKQAVELLKSEMVNEGLEINERENGREGVDFLVKSSNTKHSEVFLQPMDLIAQQSSKVPKEKLGEPKENLWIALVLFMKEVEPAVYLIPSKVFETPDQIFIDNDQGERDKHLSNCKPIVYF